MSKVGQRETRTQQRVIAFFQDALGYAYLGDWQDREGQQQHRRDAAHRLAEAAGPQRQDHRQGAVRAGQGHGRRRQQDALRRQPRRSTACCATA